MLNNIIIRQLVCVESDLSQLLEIEQSSFNRYDAYSLADFKRWLRFNPDLCLAAEKDGKIVGYVISRIRDNVCDLASIAIASNYQHCGVGQALLEATEKHIKRYGISEIDLEVRITNLTGRSFWQKMGFVPFGMIFGFYEDGGDAIRMKKKITSMGY